MKNNNTVHTQADTTSVKAKSHISFHPYQTLAISYIKSHPKCALFIQMGYGKTVITLTAIQDLINLGCVKKVLVVAPLRVARDTWRDEIEKWEHLNLSYSVCVGSESQRLKALSKDADVYIINRENVDWLAYVIEEERKKHYAPTASVPTASVPSASSPSASTQGTVMAPTASAPLSATAPLSFDMLVIDELSSFKNHMSKRFKALMTMRPYRIVGLTGTPASNGLMDLFAEFKVIDGGVRLGRFISGFREKYYTCDKYPGQQWGFNYTLRPGAEEAIYKAIGDITLGLGGCGGGSCGGVTLPELIKVNHTVHLEPEVLELYKAFKRDMVLRGVTAFNAASLSSKLLQFSSGFLYRERDRDSEQEREGVGTLDIIPLHDEKLNALEDIIEQSVGTYPFPASTPSGLLIAYWFKHERDLIKALLLRLGVPFVDLSSGDINLWKERKVPVALMHPASCGHGLNIQSGGSTLVWYTLPWSLELYEQTIARLYRQGQKENVVVMHLISEGTIDERILSVLEDKKATEEKLLDAVRMELEL